MKRFSVALALVASLAIAGTAMAGPTLVTQTGGLGFASVSGTNAVIGVGGSGNVGYALVYLRGKPTSAGKLLADVTLSATVASGSRVAGGAPRLTVPIDTNGDGKWDEFATMDWNSCGGIADANGILAADITMSTENESCAVYLNSGNGSYVNWDAFAAANPTWRVASAGSSTRPFVIADYAPTNVSLTAIDLS